MRLYDHISQVGASTAARGYLTPLAVILLQAGTDRTLGRDVQALVQAPWRWASSTDIASDVRVFDILTRRSGSTTGVREIRRNWHRPGWWLDSAQMLAIGLADEIG